jgi:hypothetical protein
MTMTLIMMKLTSTLNMKTQKVNPNVHANANFQFIELTLLVNQGIVPLAPLPCDSTYPSLGLAKDSLNFWARERGYGVSIARSKARKGGSRDICKAYLICYRDNNKSLLNRPVRRSGSRKMGCPFRATVTEREGVWMVEVQHAEHNHETSYLGITRQLILSTEGSIYIQAERRKCPFHM